VDNSKIQGTTVRPRPVYSQVLPGNLMDLGILLFVVSSASNERTMVHPAHPEDGKAVAKGNLA
jgi:hypothetical protein